MDSNRQKLMDWLIKDHPKIAKSFVKYLKDTNSPTYEETNEYLNKNVQIPPNNF